MPEDELHFVCVECLTSVLAKNLFSCFWNVWDSSWYRVIVGFNFQVGVLCFTFFMGWECTGGNVCIFFFCGIEKKISGTMIVVVFSVELLELIIQLYMYTEISTGVVRS